MEGENKMKKVLAAILCVVLMMGCFTAFAETNTGYHVEAVGDVNVRTGPGLNYATMGSIGKGTSLDYLGEASTDSRGVAWYKVIYDNGIGWVSSVYTALYANNQIAWDPQTPSVQLDTYVHATASVNVRAGAGTGYDDIGTLAKGEQVLYLGTYDYDSRGVMWYKVEYYSMGTGWVSSVYSELVFGTESGVEENGTPVVGYYVEATAGNSNLRSGPGLTYDDLDTMQKGEVASYLGSYSTDERGVVWYYVRFDGQIGWVSSRYTALR